MIKKIEALDSLDNNCGQERTIITIQDTSKTIQDTMATRGRSAHKEVALHRSSSATTPKKNSFGPSPITRQIGEQHWWGGVSYLEELPHLKEIKVAEHYHGWRYILTRTKNAHIFVKLTYWNDKLCVIELMHTHYEPVQIDYPIGSSALNYSTLGASALPAWSPPPIARSFSS